MSRFIRPSWVLGAWALSAATLCLADAPGTPNPQRAHHRKAQPGVMSQPASAATITPAAPPAVTTAADSHGIIFVGGKSAINSQPVPPGKAALNPQPIPPGKTALNPQPIPPGVSPISPQPISPGKTIKPVGPRPIDPTMSRTDKSALPR